MLHNQQAHFNVQLFLDLQFVDEPLAIAFETLDETNPNIVHFCKSVQKQVSQPEECIASHRTGFLQDCPSQIQHDFVSSSFFFGQSQVFGTIVTKAARGYNSTIVNEDPGSQLPLNNDDENQQIGEGLVGCTIVATSRVYDPEAEDVLGTGYFSLQVHVSQTVVVESTNETLYLEVVQSVVEKGFDVVSGGQREFRNHLYQNSMFRSVLSVTIRRGLTAPVPPPTPTPTKSPTTNVPTNFPSKQPTKKPTALPSRNPTAPPTPQPSSKPSRKPTAIPTKLPSTNPSASPSGYPTLNPSAHPSNYPSLVPSFRPSNNPSVGPTRFPSQSPSTEIPVLNVNWNPSRDKNNKNSQSGSLRDRNSVTVALILGSSMVLATAFCLFCFLCYKYQSKSRKYSNFRSPVPLSQNHSHGFVPGIVEVGDDHESLADTTLGSARKKRPSIRRGLGSSYDENSLYTSPYYEEREQRANVIPRPLSLLSVQSSLSSHLMTPLEYEERVVFPTSESVSDEDSIQEEVELEFSLNGSKSIKTIYHEERTRSLGPIDIDSNEPYDEQHHNPIKIAKIGPPKAHPPILPAHENDDFSRIPSDLDVWSCDFEDFDMGSDFYRAEEHSTDLSSSASTKRINNTALPSSSSLLVMGNKKQDLILKSAPTPVKSRKPMPKFGGERKVAILPTTTLLHQDRNKENNNISTGRTNLPSKLSNAGAKTPSMPKFTMPNKHATPNRIDGENKPRIVSPEETSHSSKKSTRSKKSTLSDMSKDTKTGAPTTTIDCLGSSGGLLVSSLNYGVTTINDSLVSSGIVNSLKDGAAPKIDSLSNGIVNSLRDGAPRIESLGNGLVSSLTDIFDRMAIPKITPEEYAESSPSLTSESITVTKEPTLNQSFLSKTVSDDDSGVSASPWLMEKIENTLGPKSVHADLASMTSHKTLRKKQNGSEVSYGSRSTLGIRSMNGSESSYGSKRGYYNRNRNRHNNSEVSYGSKSSRFSRYSSPDIASIMSRASASMSADVLAQNTPDEISFIKTSRSALEEKKQRLEQQLAELDEHENNSIKDINKDAASSVTMSSVTWGSLTTISSRSRTFRGRKQVIVCVPPGKLGVILEDQHDGNGTIITSIKSGSPVERILKPGDKLIAVDEIAVVDMTCSQITSLIASRADQERRFTVMTIVIKKKTSNNEEDSTTKQF